MNTYDPKEWDTTCNLVCKTKAHLETKVTKLEADIRHMVELAADQKLDGYRELGSRAAAAEERADKAVARAVEAESQSAQHCERAERNYERADKADARVRELESELAKLNEDYAELLKESNGHEISLRALQERVKKAIACLTNECITSKMSVEQAWEAIR